jgi:hypothetical protein
MYSMYSQDILGTITKLYGLIMSIVTEEKCEISRMFTVLPYLDV